MTQTPIRVLVVDDHKMMRKALISYLALFDDLEIVGEAAHGVEALEKCAEVNPHIVLMDLNMPLLDGIESTRIITNMYPNTRVIALTSLNNEELGSAALEAGAARVLDKADASKDLYDLIREISTENMI